MLKPRLRRSKPVDSGQCPEFPSAVANDNDYIAVQQFGEGTDVCKLVHRVILKRMAGHMVAQDVRRSIIIDGDINDEQRKVLKEFLDELWSDDHDGIRCLSSTTTSMLGKDVLFYTFVRPITP